MNPQQSATNEPSIDRPATDPEREQMRHVVARGIAEEQAKQTPPGSAEEADAINAISKAMGALDERARLRVADWARSVAEVEPRDTFRRLQFVMIQEISRTENAVKAHRKGNDAPTRRDVNLYAAVLGTEALTRSELVLFYSDPADEDAPEASR